MKLTSRGSVAINGAHASSVKGFSVGRKIVLTCMKTKQIKFTNPR